IGPAFAFGGSKAAFNPWDRFVVTMGNRIIVTTNDGAVWGHDVTGNTIGPAFAFGGSKAAFNPWDRFVVTMGNRIIVTTQTGRVFGHDVNGRTVGPPFPMNFVSVCQAAEEPYAIYADTVPQSQADVGNIAHALLYLVNRERIERNLEPLCYNSQLAIEARGHSDNWASDPSRGCPPHNPPLVCSHYDSRPGRMWPEDRIVRSGYGPHPSWGPENTYNGGGVSDGRDVVPAGWNWATAKAAVHWWMNHHPENNYEKNGHRKTILNTTFKVAGPGIGRYIDGFGNHAATFTMMFGDL
ncbi:CAP domain-containing protein, partial [Streptomyces chartreusis]